MAEKKDFGMTEVYETFRSLAEAGMTPEGMKAIRSSRIIALRVMLMSHRAMMSPLCVEYHNLAVVAKIMVTELRGICYCCIDELGTTALYEECPCEDYQQQPRTISYRIMEPVVTSDSRGLFIAEIERVFHGSEWRMFPMRVRGCPETHHWYVVSLKQ